MIARMRAWSALLTIVIGVPLLGAASGFAPPVVLVYPITSAGAIDTAAGGNVALIIANKLTQLGGMTIKPATPGTERAKFLDAASALGADYYITGFLTPIGVDNSLITQVVSTHSGSVVFSTTGVVRTYADALGQVDALHDAILRHAGRGLAALDAPPPAPSASPPHTANDGSVDIGKALRKRKRDTVVAAARAVPSGALLFTADGAVERDLTAQATKAVADAFARLNRPTGVLGITLGTNLAHAAAICAATPGVRELDAPTLTVGRSDSGAARVQLDLSAYDCTGVLLRTQRAVATARDRNGLPSAIAKAAADATQALTAR